jgi:CRISPR-associated exonuclease Cas4
MSNPVYSPDDYLMISGLQHYYFCKRQWGLIHIGQAWADNALTVEGNLLHAQADDPFFTEIRKDLLISRAMAVSSASLGFSGVLDVVEFHQEKDGIPLRGREGRWQPNIVEYKHGKPKKNKCDLMQLTAQAICLEEMLGCIIQSADLFYATPKRRTTVPIDTDLRQEMKTLAKELHTAYAGGVISKAESHKNCPKCSLYELCMPRLTLKRQSVTNYMNRNIEEPYA